MPSHNQLLIAKVLDGLDARYLAIASNIANAATPGYRPLRVDFEAALRTASARGMQALAQVSPSTVPAPVAGVGNEARIDLELAAASDTALRYSAMLDLLGRRSQISLAAISGGR